MHESESCMLSATLAELVVLGCQHCITFLYLHARQYQEALGMTLSRMAWPLQNANCMLWSTHNTCSV